VIIWIVAADVAELADAQASGACGLNAHGGSTPLIRIKSILLTKSAFLRSYPSCKGKVINYLTEIVWIGR
jgi:hypothetical protein